MSRGLRSRTGLTGHPGKHNSLKRGAAAAVAGLAIILVACGGHFELATPIATLTPGPSLTPESSTPSPPRPTSTPYTVTEPPASGRVRTTFGVSCSLGTYGPEIHVHADIAVLDAANTPAAITRVKVYVDGVLREDSGRISTQAFVRDSTLPGGSNRLHTIQIHIDTWAAPRPSDIIQFAQCPPTPDRPVA